MLNYHSSKPRESPKHSPEPVWAASIATAALCYIFVASFSCSFAQAVPSHSGDQSSWECSKALDPRICVVWCVATVQSAHPARGPGNGLYLVSLGKLFSLARHRQAAGRCSDSASAALAPPSNLLWHLMHNEQKVKQTENPSHEISLKPRTLAHFSLYIKP